MPEHIKIILPSAPLPSSALTRIQNELGVSLSLLQSKVDAGEPILDMQPPHSRQEDFIKSTLRLIHVLDDLGIDYLAWHNGEPSTPQHLRSLLSHKLHVRQNLRGPKERRSRSSSDED